MVLESSVGFLVFKLPRVCKKYPSHVQSTVSESVASAANIQQGFGLGQSSLPNLKKKRVLVAY